MGLQTVLLATSLSPGASLAGAWWLQQSLVQHRRTRALEEYKTELVRDAALQLGERAARRQYEYDARKRLDTAIGPLRLPLPALQEGGGAAAALAPR